MRRNYSSGWAKRVRQIHPVKRHGLADLTRYSPTVTGIVTPSREERLVAKTAARVCRLSRPDIAHVRLK